MGAYKKFDQNLKDKYNGQSIEAVLRHLNDQGSFAKVNPEQYGPDIVLFSGFKPISYIEVEVVAKWFPDEEDFPWQLVHLPERKRKFLKAGLPIEFWRLRNDFKKAIIIPEETITEDRLVEVPNRFVPKGEFFFRVPVSECIMKEL